MSSKTEIRIRNYVWKSSYIVKGHYEFEILVILFHEKTSQLSEKLYYRRFSEFEWLHSVLIESNPGCRIPTLPEKTIWTNLGVNNDSFLDRRKKDLETYLNYINRHKYLCRNAYFQEFLSDNFDKYRKAEIQNNKKISLMEIVTTIKNQIPMLKTA